jgi:CO/xanthine dehydrogenase Mo-binding subunit
MTATGIGAAVRRKEDFRFITGKGQYADDISRMARFSAPIVMALMIAAGAAIAPIWAAIRSAVPMHQAAA